MKSVEAAYLAAARTPAVGGVERRGFPPAGPQRAAGPPASQAGVGEANVPVGHFPSRKETFGHPVAVSKGWYLTMAGLQGLSVLRRYTPFTGRSGQHLAVTPQGRRRLLGRSAGANRAGR